MSQEDRYQQFTQDEAPLAFRLRAPSEGYQTWIVMLHGLTGDQSSMWALEASVPHTAGIVTPRGPYPQPQDGFAWNESIQGWPPLVSEFVESVAKLDQLLDFLTEHVGFDRRSYVLMGFSNGAAMAFAASMSPLRVQPRGLVILSGHLPEGDLTPLASIPVFWGHGMHDNFIPVSVARADAARLQQVGCQVQLCEANVGHKLGVDCMEELRGWYGSHIAPSSEKVG